MTQILLYQCRQGISLATDSRAVSFLPDGRKSSMEIHKIFPLSPFSVLVTGGAGYGVLLARELQARVESAGLARFAEIQQLALRYLPARVGRLYREYGRQPDRPELERVYFLLAGHAPEASRAPFPFALLGSEQGGEPLHLIKTGPAVAIPRQMGIEYRLSRLDPSEDELAEAESLCENFLLKLSRESMEVAPPFHFVRITAAGIRIRTRDTHQGTCDD